MRPNQVWATDITYVPMARGFVYLIAIVDWFSRRVLSWRLSITMETDFCIEALEEALTRFGTAEVFNTDQDRQFASAETVRNFVCGRTFKHYACMALMKRSPKITANCALAMVHSRGGILHSFSDRFKIR